MRWTTRGFEGLALREIYGILALRQRVFVVEQACAYLDADGRDQGAIHLFACAQRDEHDAAEDADDAEDAIVACLRILAPGVAWAEPAIGRVVTAPEVRRSGLGRELMRRGIDATRAAHGLVPIRIGAQRYLERFYGELGFVVASEPYDEDGIPHVEMLLGV